MSRPVRGVIITCAALLLALVRPASAADWLSIQGLEPEGPRLAPRVFGFGQLAAEAVIAEPVEGLTSEPFAKYNGQRASFNRVPFGEAVGLRITRLRLGARGSVPGTRGVLGWFWAAELGQNGLTAAGGAPWRPILVDASVTAATPWGLAVRVGRFKLPLSDEALEAVHVSAELVSFSIVTRRLLMERRTETGVLAGRVNGFRDHAVQIFGSHLFGRVELSWAAVAGSASIDRPLPDLPADLVTRAQVSWLLGEGPRRRAGREELSVWGFAQVGHRDVNAGSPAPRRRIGVGSQLRTGRLRLRAEALFASGVLTDGQRPPFAGGEPVYAVQGQAWGATVLGSVRLTDRLRLGAAFAHLSSQPAAGPAARLFEEVTALVQLRPKPWLRVDLNGSWRSARAPEGAPDVQTILATMGPSVALQITAIAPSPG